MDIPRRIEQEQVEEDNTVEITDLDQIDDIKSRLPPWLIRKALIWQLPENRRRWRWATILGIVFLALLVIVLILGDALSSWIASYLHIGFGPRPAITSNAASSFSDITTGFHASRQDGLACLVDAAWSPNGTSIALLGYTQTCSQSNFVPAQVNIYDAHTGKLMAHWTPDYPVTSTLHATGFFPARLRAITVRKPLSDTNVGFVSVTAIYYSHILWSPNGQHLALTFTASTRLHNFGGVLSIGSNGNHAEVFVQQQDSTDPLYSEWNLRSGGLVKSLPAPVALSYQWRSGGVLAPKTLLKEGTAIVAPQPGPIGNPDGGSSFTIWQPGLAIILSQAHSPSIYIWKTSVTAWSPDGNYLVEGVSLKAIIEPSGHHFPNEGILNDLHLNHTPLLPIRDTALLRATLGSLAMAWRPDGRVLATTNFTGSVDLYDCATGQKLATLIPHMNHTPISGSPALLRWSPDGTHLLLSSAQWGIINTWGPGQLP